MVDRKRTVRERAVLAYARCVFTRAELVQDGMKSREIAAAVRAGLLTRVRKDRYAVPQTSDDVIEAVRIGGRLSCLSLLRSMGVFVHVCEQLHVEVARGASRIRKARVKGTRVHWCRGIDDEPSLHAGSLTVAVRESIRCQAPRAAVATLDSILQHRLLTMEQLEQIFAGLPTRFAAILRMVASKIGRLAAIGWNSGVLTRVREEL